MNAHLCFRPVANFVVVASVLGLSALTAADYTSTSTLSGASTGNWSDGTKWTTPGAPAGTVPNNGSPSPTYDVIQNGGTLTVDIPVTIQKFTLSGDNNGIGQPLTIKELFTWNATGLGGTGTINADGGAVIQGGGDHAIGGGRVLNLSGTTNWDAGGIRFAGGGGTITNNGDFRINFDRVNGGLASGGTLNNAGTLTKTAGPGSIDIGAVLNNSGKIQVNSGTLRFTGSGTHTGELALVAGTTVTLNNGAFHTFAPNSSVTGSGTIYSEAGSLIVNTPMTWPAGITLRLGIALDGTGDLTLNGPLSWEGGEIKGLGTVEAKTGATMFGGTLSGTKKLVLRGASTWSAGEIRITKTLNTFSELILEQGATLTNVHAGVLRDSSKFTNKGTFIKNTSTGATDFGVEFINTGKLQLDTGIIRFSSLGTHTGEIAMAPGSSIELYNGAVHDFNTGSSITGTGLITTGNSTFRVNDTLTASSGITFRLAGGVFGKLGGAGTFNLDGTLEWVDGFIIDSVTLNVGTGAVITGAGWLTGTSKLNLGGNTTWNSGSFEIRDTAEMTVLPGATFTTAHSGTLGGSSRFINKGTFNKVTDTGVKAVTAIFTNEGTLNVNSGTLRFDRSYTQTAGALVLNGGNVSREPVTTDLTITGGKIQGSGSISAGVSAAGGTVHIDPGIGSAPGSIFIADNLTLTSGSKLSFDIGGPTPGTEHDKVMEGGGTSTSVAGVTLEVNLLNGYIPAMGTTFTVFDAATTAIVGSFANVTNGARLAIAGTSYSCKVSYGSSTAFPGNADKVILSEFATTPTSLTLDDNQIVENAPGGSTVGLLAAIDPDTSETFTFALVSGTGSTDNALFQVTGNQLQTKSTTALDFETKNSYAIRLRVTNSRGGLLEQAFTIQVQDVPAPTALALSNTSIFENQPVNTGIGSFATTDPTPGATFTYALVNGAGSTNNAEFSISGGSLLAGVTFNKEVIFGPRSIQVRVTNNGGETLDQIFSITVLDEGPSNLALSPSSILEGRAVGTTVGTFSATVVPAETNVTYALVSGTGSTHNAQFQIVGNALKTAVVPDFAAGATRSIRVRATGPVGESVDQAFTITIIQAGPPTDIALSASSVAENQPANTVVGTLSAADPDSEATFTFALVTGTGSTDNARFNLSGPSLRTSESFDFETNPGPFSIRVRVTNGAGKSYEEALIVSVTDQGPSALALSPSSILEGKADAPVGDLAVTTIVPTGTAISTWELVPGAADNAFFSLDGTTVKTVAALDFESAPTRTVRVKATDANGESFTQDLAITVGDVSLTDITLSNTTVLENVPAGTLIANLAAVISPADPGAAPAFTLVSATPSGAVALTGTQLVTIRTLSRSAEPTIALRLRATHLGETYEEDVTITVNANAGSLLVESPPGTSITSLDFGDVNLAANTSRTVTLKNPGPGHVFNVSIRNPAAPLNDYVATSSALITDPDLAPGESVTVDLTFTPQALGNRNASIVFESDNAPDKSLSVTGRGIGQEISVQQPVGTELVDGATVDFGRQPFGVSLPATTFVVKNVGVATSLGSISAAITGPDAAFFALDTQGLSTSLTEGTSSSFLVTFQPETTVVRTYNATLRITSNDADENPFDIPLTGESVTPLMIAQTAYAKASDTGASDNFGTSVAVSGNTVVVGAPFEDGTDGVQLSNSGSVYVFVRDVATGAWSQQAKLRSSNPGAGDLFGDSVAVSGDTVVVGAIGEDSSTTGINSTPNELASAAGAAYVFVRSGTTWSQQAYLKASQVNANDAFGTSVAVSGDTVVVGATGEDSSTTGINSTPNEGAGNAGAAYLFLRSGTTWSQQAYLKPDAVGTMQAGDLFGISVAVSGDTVVVGANQEDSSTTGINSAPNESSTDAGAAYVFVRSGTTWSQQAYLKASQVNANDAFGISVAVSGDTVVVGATGEDSSTTGINSTPNEGAGNAGAAYLFLRSGTTWSQQAYLKQASFGTTQTDDKFGSSVAISGGMVIVGANGEDSSTTGINSTPNENASRAGAAYVFERSGTTWSQQAYLKASQVNAIDQFGIAVAVSGDTVVVGAQFENSSTTGINSTPNELAPGSGAAYIFEVTPPEVIVHDGATTGSPKLADNQAQAVDYGPTPLGISVARSFTINNVRALPLTVSSITAPPGYSVAGAPTAPIPAQSSATFSVLLTGLTLGTNSGNVTITTNDSANPEFVFPITGEVLTLAPGSLDPRFGTNGVVRVDFGANERAFDMLMTPDGRLVLGGERVANSVSQFALARLLSTGALDTSFGGSGKVSMTVPGVSNPSITGICLQDDKIVAAGSSVRNDSWFIAANQPSFALARYLPDGSLDSTFGTAGFDVDNSLTEGDFTWNIVTHPSGKLLVGGMVSGTLQAYVRRFNQNGGRDASFGANGTLLLSSGTFGGALTVNAAGDIFAAGSSMPTFRARLWKISSTGTQASLTLPKAAPVGYPLDQLTADGESATAIALQPDGKPVIAANRSGHFDRNLGHGFITGRAVTSMTSADTTYNGTGVTIEDISPAANREQANSVAVQQDGKLVVVGQVDGSWVIVRYTTTGELDPSFGNGGKVVLYLGGSGSAYKVLLDSAGDIYVAGHASNGTTQDFVVMKLIGSVDHDPAIVVRNGGTSTSPVLVNGQTSAINFGTPRVGSSGVTKDFRINNLGNGPLTIDSITVPTGYQITSSVTSVAAGASATLNIKLKANILGTFNGPVTITTNDPAQGVFTFPVTGSVVPNSPPVFKGLTISTVQGIATTISFAKILANTSDANDDPLSIGPLPASTSVGGASLAFTGTDSISYTPPLDLIGVDTFQVLIADGIDKTEGTISVNVTQDPALNPKNPPQLSVNGTTGALTITFSGLPNRTYTIQRSSNLVTWIDLGTAKADKLGAITFTDPSPPQPSAFYRLKL